MGLLRLLFALSIVIFHSGLLWNYNIATEYIAVYSFFIISGFYISLILDTKYKNKSVTLFWGNRMLRIFPLYWLVLSSIVIFTILKYLFHIGTPDNAIEHFLTHSQVSLFQIINFITRNITLILTTDYLLKSDSTGGYLLVQQAWTLQLELIFYLIAPYLMKLSQKIFIVITIIYLLLFGLVIQPFQILPSYTLTHAFASTLVFFLLGMLSYTLLFKNISKITLPPKLPFFILTTFIIYLLGYNFFQIKIFPELLLISDPFYYLCLTCAIPFIYKASYTNRIDSFIGSLSYPIYITHFLIIKIVVNLSLFQYNSNIKTLFVLFVTLVLSIILVKFIENPINSIRQKRLKITQ